MRVNGTNLAMIRGDTESITLSCFDSNNMPVPLVEGDTLYFTIKDSLSTTNKKLQRVVTKFPDGKAIIEINPEDTKSWSYGDYFYDVQLTKSTGVVTTIVTPSMFSILGEVTYE